MLDVFSSEMDVQMTRDDEIDGGRGIENHAHPRTDEGQEYSSSENNGTSDNSSASYGHDMLVQVIIHESVPGRSVPPDRTE